MALPDVDAMLPLLRLQEMTFLLRKLALILLLQTRLSWYISSDATNAIFLNAGAPLLLNFLFLVFTWYVLPRDMRTWERTLMESYSSFPKRRMTFTNTYRWRTIWFRQSSFLRTYNVLVFLPSISIRPSLDRCRATPICFPLGKDCSTSTSYQWSRTS